MVFKNDFINQGSSSVSSSLVGGLVSSDSATILARVMPPFFVKLAYLILS
jgi:hypothetical protein